MRTLQMAREYSVLRCSSAFERDLDFERRFQAVVVSKSLTHLLVEHEPRLRRAFVGLPGRDVTSVRDDSTKPTTVTSTWFMLTRKSSGLEGALEILLQLCRNIDEGAVVRQRVAAGTST